MTTYLLCYDVATADGDRRLREVARVCEGHGVRVQKSVFELRLGEAHMEQLLSELVGIIDPVRDSVRIYAIPGAPAHDLGRSVLRTGPTHW